MFEYLCVILCICVLSVCVCVVIVSLLGSLLSTNIGANPRVRNSVMPFMTQDVCVFLPSAEQRCCDLPLWCWTLFPTRLDQRKEAERGLGDAWGSLQVPCAPTMTPDQE